MEGVKKGRERGKNKTRIVFIHHFTPLVNPAAFLRALKSKKTSNTAAVTGELRRLAISLIPSICTEMD